MPVCQNNGTCTLTGSLSLAPTVLPLPQSQTTLGMARGARRDPGRDGGAVKGSKPRVREKLEQQVQLSLLQGASSIRPRQKHTIL